MLLSRLFRSGVAAALLRPPSGKSAQLQLAVAIQSGDFFIDVFKNNGADEWRKLWGCQHAVDDRCRETGALPRASGSPYSGVSETLRVSQGAEAFGVRGR